MTEKKKNYRKGRTKGPNRTRPIQTVAWPLRPGAVSEVLTHPQGQNRQAKLEPLPSGHQNPERGCCQAS